MYCFVACIDLYFVRCILQESFGLSSSNVLCRRGAGHNVVSPEAGGRGQGLCLNRWNSVGPETDSLDHRARVCYFPCGLLYDELHCTIDVNHSRLPPPYFKHALHLINQGLYHS